MADPLFKMGDKVVAKRNRKLTGTVDGLQMWEVDGLVEVKLNMGLANGSNRFFKESDLNAVN